MLICGYPGIGKSTLAKKRDDIIDLESHNFGRIIDGEFKKYDGWWESYCRVAADLHNQGYIVLLANYMGICKWLKEHEYTVYGIYPGIEVKDYWLEKCKARWDASKSPKDERAYERVKDHFNEDIGINNGKFGLRGYMIRDKDYSLESIIEYMRDKFIEDFEE